MGQLFTGVPGGAVGARRYTHGMKLGMKLTAAAMVTALAAALAADFPQIEPHDLAARLQAKGQPPTLIHVGFDTLYRGKHIPGSIYAGPGRTPEGLAALKAAVAKLPHNAEIVLYCGCCPWDHCPNIRPAFALLHDLGYTHVKALYIPTNLKADWIDPGYPVE